MVNALALRRALDVAGDDRELARRLVVVLLDDEAPAPPPDRDVKPAKKARPKAAKPKARMPRELPEAQQILEQLVARHGSGQAVADTFGIGIATVRRVARGLPASPSTLERLRVAVRQATPKEVRRARAGKPPRFTELGRNAPAGEDREGAEVAPAPAATTFRPVGSNGPAAARA